MLLEYVVIFVAVFLFAILIIGLLSKDLKYHKEQAEYYQGAYHRLMDKFEEVNTTYDYEDGWKRGQCDHEDIYQ